MLRDDYFGEAPDDFGYEGLAVCLNRLNAYWVWAVRRRSPAVLIELLAQSGADYTTFLASLDSWAPTPFAGA